MAKILLSREAYFHNLSIIAQKVGELSKVAVVLKDNAYGHGLLEMAQLSQEFGVSQAVVHNYQEAKQIRVFFETILVLAGQEYKVDTKMHYGINALSQIEKMPKGANVELKVDTGMHRNGVAMAEVAEALEQIYTCGLDLKGVFTHNRSADTLSSEWFWQAKNFEQVKKQVRIFVKENALDTPRFHSANSASTFRFGRFSEDLIRVGIAAYGCLEMDVTLAQPELKPVMKLYGEKIATRTLHAGEHVGYNATFKSKKEMLVSSYDVGYADGLLRAASNNYTTPEGEKLLGRVSMDNSSFSGEREQLLIFDNVNRYAKSANSIAYEVLVGLHHEIKRVIV